MSRIVGKVRESISFCLRQSRIVVIVFARGTHKPQYKWHAREDCIYKETLFLLRVRYFAAICSKSQIDSSSWSNSRKRDSHPESISHLIKKSILLKQNRPKKNGTPERTRTPNPLIRSQMLYPIEPRAHAKQIYFNFTLCPTFFVCN